MELKLSECVFFAAWEPHDSSSHVWWTINSAQVAAAMGAKREREEREHSVRKKHFIVFTTAPKSEKERGEGAAGPGVL